MRAGIFVHGKRHVQNIFDPACINRFKVKFLQKDHLKRMVCRYNLSVRQCIKSAVQYIQHSSLASKIILICKKTIMVRTIAFLSLVATFILASTLININISQGDARMQLHGITSPENKTEMLNISNDQGKQMDEKNTFTAAGLKPKDVAGVVIHEKYGYGVGGILIMQYEPYLLLTDGSILRDPGISPYELDVATSKEKHPEKWGKWQLQGKILVVQMPEKGVMKTSQWADKRWFWTRPASNGEIINGSFMAISGGGNTISGGTTSIAVTSTIRFNSQGKFTHATSAGATSGGAAGTGAIYSDTQKAGTYILKGYAIELHYNNGQIAKTLFYFFPDTKDTFGMGSRTYTKD